MNGPAFVVSYAAMEKEMPRHMALSSHTIPIVPRYAETDRGGVVHHSVFPVWFEMGRTELLRANGVAYRDLEEAGIFFVVAELRIKSRRPAFYDAALLLQQVLRVPVELGKQPVSYTHLRAHETVLALVFRPLLEKKK